MFEPHAAGEVQENQLTGIALFVLYNIGQEGGNCYGFEPF